MAKFVSIFNNKGGVGKSTICWNLADSLARLGKQVLMIDFDPQCNLSIAVLGEETFVHTLPVQNAPYGKTIRSFLQRFLQSLGGEEVFLHTGVHTHPSAKLIAGDFWLNVYGDSLNVGADILTGTGLSRYVALRRIVAKAEEVNGTPFDYVLIDLPPSFGAMVRAAFYSSDYYIVPCTSDNFSVYCLSLIGQMVPSFIQDWETGLQRFKGANIGFEEFDLLGKPRFAGWIFNGFDTLRDRRTKAELSSGVAKKEKKMVLADQTLHDRLTKAVADDLVQQLKYKIKSYDPVKKPRGQYKIGEIEDANVLAQNSLWLNVPLRQLSEHLQVKSLQDRGTWAENQIEQITLLGNKMDKLARSVIANCT